MTPPTSSQDPEPTLAAAAPLSVEDPGDALALVQHTFGRIPEQSLVLIGLMAGHTGGHLRVDLEPARTSPFELGERCARWIAGPEAEPAPEAVLAVIIDTQAPDQDAPDAYDALIAALDEGLRFEADASLVKVWHCGGGHIRDYECWDAQCCSYPGENVDEVLTAALQRVPALAGTRARAPHEALEEFLRPVPHSTESQSPVSQSTAPQSAAAPSTPVPGLTLWDAALSGENLDPDSAGGEDRQWPEPSPGHAAALLETLGDPGQTALLMVLTTSGAESAVGYALQGETGAALCGSAIWGTSPLPPQWERVEALDTLLGQLVAFAQGDQTAQILSLKAWIEWIRGRGSHATAFAEKVRELGPDRWQAGSAAAVARAVLSQISSVGVCPWAQVKRSSYSWWASSRNNFSS